MFHAASCETDEDVIKINKCSPMAETECEDVEVPSQKMEFVIKCQNVTTTYCSNDLTTVHADGVENNNIEESFAPIVPLLEHTCVETVQEYCYQEPEVTDIQTIVSRCLVSRLPFFDDDYLQSIFQVKTFVECELVDHKIPKRVCTQEPITFSG